MDGYLRLILFVVAIIIVVFIIFESWYRRRQARLQNARNGGMHSISMNPDEILGLDPREPTLDRCIATAESGAPRCNILNNNAVSMSPPPDARSNAAYAQKTYAQPTTQTPKKTSSLHDLIVISVVANPDMPFASYDLLQAITGAGMQFGEMNIFHYKEGGETLFSLSSTSEPGDFNLDRIGDLSCDGLSLFANLREVSNPQRVFELMLGVAEQLAEDLDGELRAGTRRPWTEEAYQYYQNKVAQYS